MKRRVIVHIHDDGLRIGEALRLICDGVYFDNACFERDCAWRIDTELEELKERSKK